MGFLKQIVPRRARHLLTIEIGQVFVENLREQNTTEGILFTAPLQSRVGVVGGAPVGLGSVALTQRLSLKDRCQLHF